MQARPVRNLINIIRACDYNWEYFFIGIHNIQSSIFILFLYIEKKPHKYKRKRERNNKRLSSILTILILTIYFFACASNLSTYGGAINYYYYYYYLFFLTVIMINKYNYKYFTKK